MANIKIKANFAVELILLSFVFLRGLCG